MKRVRVGAARVVCVENPTAFYELVRHEGDKLAALCLWGTASPASRQLLRCLADGLPPHVSLFLWADTDYGGLNILAQLRARVSPCFEPFRMDCATLDTYAHWARPLTTADERRER